MGFKFVKRKNLQLNTKPLNSKAKLQKTSDIAAQNLK